MRYVIDDGLYYILRYVTPAGRYSQTRVLRESAAPPWIERIWQLLEARA